MQSSSDELSSFTAHHILVNLRCVVPVPVHQTSGVLPYGVEVVLHHFMIGHYLAQLNLVGDPLVGEVEVDALRNLLGIGPDLIGETGGYGWDRTGL